MKPLIVLQARMSSSRLPGKVLMPVAGWPLVVLAVKRATNRGADLVVATSHEPSDDPLVEALQRQGIRVVRGSLDDVLGRFVAAVGDAPDETAIVRLTGDNLVPDGAFLDELVGEFEASGLEYLGTNSPRDRLPYGLSAEVFRAGGLRQAQALATTAYEREHVTPWLKAHVPGAIYTPPSLDDGSYSQLRVTVDDEADYVRMCGLFEGVDDPVLAGWQELIKRLAKRQGEPQFRVPFREAAGAIHSELTLGTVQLGMSYGRANVSGQPALEEAGAIVHMAVAHGVTALDTARAYGESESVLGSVLTGAWHSRVQVVTKLDPLANLSESAAADQVNAAVDASVAASQEALRLAHLPVLLLHRWELRNAWNGEAWRRLVELRNAGKIGKLGASVSHPWEAREALADDDVKHLQIPFNVLDWRWAAAGVDVAALRRQDVVVHARSALLQGVLAASADAWPDAPGVDAAQCVSLLRSLVSELHRQSVVDLCLSYARSQPWITSVVVGCETAAQLKEILEMFRNRRLTLPECEKVRNTLPQVSEALLNPANWTKFQIAQAR